MGVTMEEILREYRSVGIGPVLLEEINHIVRAVSRSYDPVIYAGAARWEEALEDLVQEFGLEVLVGQGQLAYAVTVATDHQHFRRLLARQVRYLLARRRRRTIVDNLIDRAHRIVGSSPFRMVVSRSGWSYTLADKRVRRGYVTDAKARSVASRLVHVPTIRGEPTRRAPVVYSERSLRAILTQVADAVPCAVSANDLDRVLSLLLTSWLPRFLKEGEAVVASAAAAGLDPEELVIVDDVTSAIRASCSDEELEVLRLKLGGVSDRRIGERLGLSRPTVSKRKRAVMERLDDVLAGLQDPLRLAVLDRLGAGPAERELR